MEIRGRRFSSDDDDYHNADQLMQLSTPMALTERLGVPVYAVVGEPPPTIASHSMVERNGSGPVMSLEVTLEYRPYDSRVLVVRTKRHNSEHSGSDLGELELHELMDSHLLDESMESLAGATPQEIDDRLAHQFLIEAGPASHLVIDDRQLDAISMTSGELIGFWCSPAPDISVSVLISSEADLPGLYRLN